jgi:glycogen debranching enzyme
MGAGGDNGTVSDVSPWAPTSAVPSLGAADGVVTLVEGQTFCLSTRSGDIAPDRPDGLFVLDTRVLSRWQLRVNGAPVEPLTVWVDEPFSATFVGRVHPPHGRTDADVVVFRHRHVGRGMRERLVLRSYGLDPVPVTVEVLCDADFASVFEVKEGRHRHHANRGHEVDPDRLQFNERGGTAARSLEVRLSEPALTEPGMVVWRSTLVPGEPWERCLELGVTLDGGRVEPLFRCGEVDDLDTVPSRRMERWRATLPEFDSDDPSLNAAIARSGQDLGALRIFDPERPDLAILAAGAPWFMTVFGRDSILTAWMTLIADPTLALGVLETLARFQGSDVRPQIEEEPGKIVHEMRFGGAAGLALGAGDRYYGSVDATPLFVMLLGELRRWGLARDVGDRLLPHADRALEWIETFGDRDGDGYVEYQRSHPESLANQGWKDSWDGIRFADGRFPRSPIALAEVQGYVYSAYLARAYFAQEAGDTATLERYRAKAAALRRRFNEDFWLEERGWFALALDGDKRPIDALASNMGHCLWTGIVDEEHAPLVAKRLLSDDLWSGFGIRTLAMSMASYNPVSYHNGSVWPHDNALCAAGLARYGFVEEAHRVIEGQLAVAVASEGRLPELFAGFARDDLPVPAAYPTSCSPQAWAAASPLLWLRTLLRLDPWAPHGQVWLDPVLPDWLGGLRVEGIEVGGEQLNVEVADGEVKLSGAGRLDVVRHPRDPITGLLG